MRMWWTWDWKAVSLLPDGVLFTTTTLLIRTLALPEPGWHTETLQVLAARHWTLKYPPPAKSSRNSPNYLGGGGQKVIHNVLFWYHETRGPHFLPLILSTDF